ncbi:hypothetical protein LJC59_01065 [Desulfovibrio sp. OttesenSCG-928-A18]|nr:hypothetical protein [Desulfovibrio sp. OttesenSCG-928-A18]
MANGDYTFYDENGRLVWPKYMPHPQRSGYGYQPVDRRTKTDMEIGSVYRTEFDTDETTLECSLILPPDLAAVFEAFEYHALHGGATWFELPVMVAGRIKHHTVRFREHPSASILGTCHTQYTLSLDVQKRHLLCPEDMAALMENSPCQIRAFEKGLAETNIIYSGLVASMAGITIMPTDLPPFFQD